MPIHEDMRRVIKDPVRKPMIRIQMPRVRGAADRGNDRLTPNKRDVRVSRAILRRKGLNLFLGDQRPMCVIHHYT